MQSVDLRCAIKPVLDVIDSFAFAQMEPILHHFHHLQSAKIAATDIMNKNPRLA